MGGGEGSREGSGEKGRGGGPQKHAAAFRLHSRFVQTDQPRLSLVVVAPTRLSLLPARAYSPAFFLSPPFVSSLWSFHFILLFVPSIKEASTPGCVLPLTNPHAV